MHPDRIAKLLEPFLGPAIAQDACHPESSQRPDEEPAVPGLANEQRLTANDLNHISTYIDLLLRWNSHINLTAIRQPEQIVTRHFGESLFAARHLFPHHSEIAAKENQRPAVESRVGQKYEEEGGRAALQGRAKGGEDTGALAPEDHDRQFRANDQRPATNDRVADLGSGAGFPGIPIKLWAPRISLTLIESNQKKATFLREVTRALTLTDVNILTTRAETLPPASYDLVTLRAVERFETIVPVAAELVSTGGRLALLIGSSQLMAVKSKLPELTWREPLSIPGSHTRVLVIASSSKG